MQAVVVIVASLPGEQRRAALSTMLAQIVQRLQHSLEKERRTSQTSANNYTSKAAELENESLALFDRLTVILR